jgi:hypothetical protein
MTQIRNYKLICLIALWGLFCGSLGVNISKAAAAANSKELLTQADFTYMGAFAMPLSSGGGDATSGIGLTHRYVNGELHMFAGTMSPQTIYEVKVPTPSTGSTLPTATVVRNWGDGWWSKAYTANGGTKWLYGLYWDEQDKRLYWSFGDPYTTSGSDSAFGYSILDDATGTATDVGSYGFSKGQKSAMGCIFPIPQWFADAYTGLKRLGAGCGGYFSIVYAGGVSMGPALAAFSPPTSSTPDRSSLAFTDLIGYPFTDVVYGPPDRVHRDTDYSGGPDWLVWPAQNGIGYFTAGDGLYQAGTWIDLPDKHGVIYFPTISHGLIHYISSSIEGGGSENVWFVYDPADLAKVAQGQKQQWEIQPSEWRGMYPGLSAGGAWRDMPSNMVTGVTFDPTTRRLYVGVKFAAPGGLYGTTKVYVYEVQSGSNPADTTPPAAPRGLRVR